MEVTATTKGNPLKTVHIPSHKIKWLGFVPYLFISPYFLIYLAFSLFPVIYTFYVSLTEWSGFTHPVFIGIKNYATLLKDGRFYSAMGNTLIFMSMIIPTQIVLGMLTAVILSSKTMIARDTYRLLNFLPYITTPVAMGYFLVFCLIGNLERSILSCQSGESLKKILIGLDNRGRHVSWSASSLSGSITGIRQCYF